MKRKRTLEVLNRQEFFLRFYLLIFYVSHDPKLGKLFYTQNEVLGLFTYLNLVHFFWATLVPKLEKILFKMKLDTKGYSRLPILNSTIIF